MEKAKISAIQLFSLMYIFQLGTALVVGYGVNAGKDAWLSILLGMGGGMVLFFIYYCLFRQYPNLALTAYARKIFGKYLGWIVGLFYILYFLNLGARNLRDFGDLLIASTLRETPLAAIIITLVIVSCYVLNFGVEVFGRTAEVFIVILLLFGASGNFFVLVSGNVDLDNLRPFLEDGWEPILRTAILDTFFFPFGEVVVFAMLLPYLDRSQSVKKVWLSALLASGLLLSWTASLNIAVLGIDVMERATFPTLATVGKVNLYEFIQRLDALVVFTLLITVFFKASVLFYGAVIGIKDLFKLPSHQQILLPTGGIMIFISLSMASNFSEHLEEGTLMRDYLHLPFILIIPLLMLFVVFIRNRFKKKTN